MRSLFSRILGVTLLAASLAAAPRPLLTTVEQIRSLTPEEARLRYPVRITGVVTYADPSYLLFFVHDSKGGIYVFTIGTNPSSRAGDLVRVDGHTDSNPIGNFIAEPAITPLGKAALPAPQEIPFEQIADGEADSQWIEIRGKVLTSVVEDGRLVLYLSVAGKRVKVMVRNFPEDNLEWLAGASLRVQGVYSARVDAEGHVTRYLVVAPSLSQVRLEKAAKPESGCSLRSLFPLPDSPDHRTHACGTVTARAGKLLFLQDGERTMQVQTSHETSVQPGDRVEAVGLPWQGDYTAVMTEAEARALDKKAQPLPALLKLDDALAGNYDSRLVQIEAVLISQVPDQGQQVLKLEAGDGNFEASSADLEGGTPWPEWRPGSRLRLTGVCTMLFANGGKTSVHLLLRSPQDVTLITSPPWWTERHLWWVLSALAVAVLLALTWIAALGYQVREKTEIIRRKLEREAQLEQRYTDLFENAKDLVFTSDLAGRITSLNRAGERITGYTRKDVLGTNLIDLIATEDQDRARRWFQDIDAHLESPPDEVEIVCRNGERRTLEFSPRRILQDGKPAGVEGIARDVTERRRGERALRESERRFRELLENVNLAAAMTNLEGRITFCNEYLLRITGWTSEEVVGQPWTEFVPPEYRDVSVLEFRKARQNRQLHSFTETAVLTKDGKRRLIQWNNTALRNPTGGFDGTASLGVDVTEHRALQEQYLHAQKLESVGRLAGGVAHDFNNLLTVINGYSDLLFSELSEDDPRRAHVQEVQKAGERAATLTQQLVTFSRKQITQARPISLNTLVSGAEEMLRRLVGERIEFRTNLDPSLGPVLADFGQMHQVLMNLVVNAKDAMPDGGSLIVETANVLLDEDYALEHSGVEPGSYVLLTITDTGVGMDEETRQHIFEPFFTTKAKGSGTGFGLSTVYGIVKQTSGWIWVYSEPGKGSSFRIYLPRIDASAPIEEVTEPVAGALQGSETVLIVEDQEDVRKLATAALGDYGYHVLAAGDGPEALALIERCNGSVHLMVTDVVMPGMTGLELAERVHLLQPNMRILLMSGYTEQLVGQDGTSGDFPFLQKPFSPKTLAAKVRELLGAKPATGTILLNAET